MFGNLNKNNFLLYATKYYDNPNCSSVAEFKSDLKRIKYIKRLLNRYLKRGSIKERLILNHIIIMRNCFGVEMTTKMLFFKLEKELYPALKTFLVFLDMIPEKIYDVGEEIINCVEIPIDPKIANALRKI